MKKKLLLVILVLVGLGGFYLIKGGVALKDTKKVVSIWIDEGWLEKIDLGNNLVEVRVKNDIFETRKIWGLRFVGYILEKFLWIASKVPILSDYLKKHPHSRFPYLIHYLKGDFFKNKKIALDCQRTLILDEQVVVLSEIENIEELNLKYCESITGEFLKEISGTKFHRGLKRISLGSYELTHRNLRFIPTETLVELELVDARSDAFLSFCKFKKLRKLILSGFFDGINLDKFPRGLKELELGYISGGEFKRESAEKLPLNKFDNIEVFKAIRCSNLEAKVFLKLNFPKLREMHWVGSGYFGSRDVERFLGKKFVKTGLKVFTDDQNILKRRLDFEKLIGAGNLVRKAYVKKKEHLEEKRHIEKELREEERIEEKLLGF